MKYNVSPHRKLKTDIVQLVRLASDAAAEERDISLRSKSLDICCSTALRTGYDAERVCRRINEYSKNNGNCIIAYARAENGYVNMRLDDSHFESVVSSFAQPLAAGRPSRDADDETAVGYALIRLHSAMRGGNGTLSPTEQMRRSIWLAFAACDEDLTNAARVNAANEAAECFLRALADVGPSAKNTAGSAAECGYKLLLHSLAALDKK
ncbi:MAG: hypothetical protein ACI4NF_07715 [Christensenellales bacterium]